MHVPLKIILHSLEEKKPICSKEYRASENKKAFPESWAMGLTMFNPLSPNSDQHQFSPNNIHTLSRD